jgi:citrate lyase beta subunit
MAVKREASAPASGSRLTPSECLTYKDRTPSTLHRIRSLLFAPGSDERKLARALESEADAVIADLEDAVAPGEKDAARALVRRTLGGTASRALRTVRVNGLGSEHFTADLEAIRGLPLDGIVLPKASPGAVDALGPEGPPVLALIETATGLRAAFEIASRPRVAALVLGAADLGAELGLEARPDGLELLHARSTLVVDSAAAGIRSPIDVVFLDTRDADGLERETRLARSLGFGGKACIHPAQVPVVNGVFAPSEDELAWAESVLDAYENGVREGRGAVSLAGEMVDVAVVERARRLIALSSAGEAGEGGTG